MRILCIFNAYLFPSEGQHGITGGEKHFLEVVSVWKKNGVQFEVLTTPSGAELCRLYDLGPECRILRFDGSRLGAVGAYLLRALEGAVSAAAYRGNVCTYSATDILPDVVPAVAVKLLSGGKSRMICFVAHLIPHFAVRQGPKLTNVVSYLAQRISLLLVSYASDKVLALNTELKQQLISMGFRNTRIVVDPMGIDRQKIDRAQPAADLSFDACFVGRLHISKGIFDLIEIWKLVTMNRPRASLAILYGAASKGILEEIRKRLEHYNLTDRVYIPGIVPSDYVYSVMKSSKVFVFPSHEEGWGIVICEAMAAGLPVVAYDLPVYAEFFTQGLTTVNLGDYESFADAILDLLSDENKREEMGKKAAQIASTYTWEETAERELAEITGRVRRSEAGGTVEGSARYQARR